MTSATYSTEITMEPTMSAPAPKVVSGESLRIGGSRTRRFVGREHGAGISYFYVDNGPGEGPDLHWHPYPETWVVIEGTPRITIGDHTFEAGEGDTATVPTGVWHGFKNAGTGRLRMLCIHASDVIVQTWASSAE
jgi:mannose-6-phosphate isomerase-like protein (cupin superfamily)